MTIIRKRIVPLLIVGAIALAGVGCTKDKMMGDGNMMSDTGSMNTMDSHTKMQGDKGMMKN
jgi:hypothetical protein